MLIVNERNETLRKKLLAISNEADTILIASAFFTETEMINNWLLENKKLELIISLRPPTNYFSLKKILDKVKVNYLGDKFHSKIYIFKKSNEILNAVVGSSNFTSGGLEENIETNILITDRNTLVQLDRHYLDLKSQSKILDADILKKYKGDFEDFIKQESKNKRKLEAFYSEEKSPIVSVTKQKNGTLSWEIYYDSFDNGMLSQERIKLCIDEFVKTQEKFFLTGDLEELVPLTKSLMAKNLGVDVSSVSRIFSERDIKTDFGVFNELDDELFTEGSKMLDGSLVSCHVVYYEIWKIIEEEDKRMRPSKHILSIRT